jgi:hypothetical protein
MANAFSLAQVAEDLQNYALDHKEYIVDKVLEIGIEGIPGSPIKPLSSFMNILPATGEVVLTDLLRVDPLQPGNKDSFNPKAYATFKTRKAKPEPVKVDLLFQESKVRLLKETYMNKVRMRQLDPGEIPFEEYMLNSLAEDVSKYLRLATFKAVKNPAGTTSAALFDGILHQIEDIITAAPLTTNLVELNALTIDNCVYELEKMAMALPSNVAFAGDTVMMVPKSIRDLYIQSYRKLFTAFPSGYNTPGVFLQQAPIELIVEDGMNDFDLPILTTRNNLVALIDNVNIGNVNFDYQKRDRSLAILMDFEYGAGISASELLWIGAID